MAMVFSPDLEKLINLDKKVSTNVKKMLFSTETSKKWGNL